MFYWIWPLLLALVPIALKVKRLRFALFWISLTYVVSSLAIAIIPVYLMVTEKGVGDPQLMAGQIAENLVTSMLLVVIDIPLALFIFWAFKKFKIIAK